MKRAIAGIVLLSILIFLGYLVYVARQIARQSNLVEDHAADVIIVMGAAEYRGHPSPILLARINHALVLYLKGLAPYV
jgi:hypothetical protein